MAALRKVSINMKLLECAEFVAMRRLNCRQTDICQYTAKFGGFDCLPNGGNIRTSGAVFVEWRH